MSPRLTVPSSSPHAPISDKLFCKSDLADLSIDDGFDSLYFLISEFLFISADYCLSLLDTRLSGVLPNNVFAVYDYTKLLVIMSLPLISLPFIFKTSAFNDSVLSLTLLSLLSLALVTSTL
jgi:hypothetical protein